MNRSSSLRACLGLRAAERTHSSLDSTRNIAFPCPPCRRVSPVSAQYRNGLVSSPEYFLPTRREPARGQTRHTASAKLGHPRPPKSVDRRPMLVFSGRQERRANENP